MLLEFSVSNFLSFREWQRLPLQAAPIKPGSPAASSNTFSLTPKLELLKSKAIYGANASGKSNWVRALVAMLKIVQQSVKDERILPRMIVPFALHPASKDTASLFEVVIVWERTQYRYGFTATSREVESEWLFALPLNTTTPVKERYYFLREGNDLKVNGERFHEGKRIKPPEGERPLFRDNSLVLSTLAAFNGEVASQIVGYLRDRIHVISDAVDESSLLTAVERFNLASDDYRSYAIQLLQAVDPTIGSIEPVEVRAKGHEEERGASHLEIARFGGQQANHVAIVRTSQASEGQTTAQVPFLLVTDEAAGTQRLFGLSFYLYQVFRHGGVLVVDEFDAHMHPNLTRKIVELFHNPDANPNSAQLIFITHDSNLLDPSLLRRDQITFAAKDSSGVTALYSLAEIKGVRNHASFEREYLAGKYRAVPTHLNQMEAVVQAYLPHEPPH